MFDQLKALARARKVQKELKSLEVEAQSSNGWIRVVFSGEMHLKDITISEVALKPENKWELEKNLKQVVTEALSRTQAVAAEKTKAAMKDLNLNIPGL